MILYNYLNNGGSIVDRTQKRMVAVRRYRFLLKLIREAEKKELWRYAMIYKREVRSLKGEYNL